MDKDEKKNLIMREQGRRLAAARLKAGFKNPRQAALAPKFGERWPEATYRAHEKGTRKIGDDDAERYAQFYRTRGVAILGRDILYEPSWVRQINDALTWERIAPMVDAAVQSILAAPQLGELYS